MRWKRPLRLNLAYGTCRTRRKFLFLPLLIGDEYRWLEAVIIEQIWVKDIHNKGKPSWENIRWVN